MSEFLSMDEVDKLLRGPKFIDFVIVRKLNDKNRPDVVHISETIERVCTEQLGMVECTGNPCSMTLFIAVGGDGTMCLAMKMAAIHGAVAVGINLGRVGFLTDMTPNRYEDRFEEDLFVLIDSAGSKITERMLLENNTRLNELALNEFTLSGIHSDTMIEYELLIDGAPAGEHRANSVIISTPTGSTAYSLSAGGCLILPEMEVIQITPVAAMSMTSRPIVVSGSSVVSVVVNQDFTFKCDGHVVQKYEFGSGRIKIDFTASKNKARVLHDSRWNFFGVLTEKLGWNHK